ncbi:MAG TPA: nucleotidyl transferase AbiEii/AbiGii toxin family protein [Microbacterium sp.]|nr:nucleotidyl transferase AbiEii/AbiGii toxin family protein [Microbacterium sp.]
MSDPFSALPEKSRTPTSASILNQWVSHAEQIVGARGDRTRWVLASTIVAAALQRALMADDTPLFVVKGGVFIERALNLQSRATKDLDTLFRGAVEEFEQAADDALDEPWGMFDLTRTAFTVIEGAKTSRKPRRFNVLLDIKGKRWANIKVEVSFPEGSIDKHVGTIPAPSTTFFGIEQPSDLATITMAYQVAQKLHACTDPHNPPDESNLRVRDLVDLYLIKQTFYPDDADLTEVRSAAVDVFSARAEEAKAVGSPSRTWPPVIVSNELWESEWAKPAGEAGVVLSLGDVLEALNKWVAAIEQAEGASTGSVDELTEQ